MQSDILYKQLITKLNDLKTAIERFERHNPPSTTYTEDLHKALNEANKLTSAYAVLKEHKDVSPDLNLHLKLMNVENASTEVKIVETKHEVVEVESKLLEKRDELLDETTNSIPQETTPQETTSIVQQQNSTIQQPTGNNQSPITNYPRFTININDKFRIINEMFLGNSTEYNMAIEQLNTLNSQTEATVYLRELKKLYNWNDESEMVKKVTALVQKRFV